MRAALIRLTNVALFTMACWLVSVVFNEILAERLQPRVLSAYGGGPHAVASAPAWDERKVIIDRNLFGAKVAREKSKPPPPPVVDEPEEVEETKLPLELLGTVWSSDSNLSTAAIRDTANRIDQVVAVGEVLEERDQVTVAAIERGRVILQNGSRREELLLSEEGTGPGGRPPASAPTASRESPSDASRPGSRPSRSSVASAGSSRASRSPVAPYTGPLSSQAAKRRAERQSRAEAKAKKRAMTGMERMLEANKLATGRERISHASQKQQEEAQQVMESLIESGASPDEITKRMEELEMQHRGAK